MGEPSSVKGHQKAAAVRPRAAISMHRPFSIYAKIASFPAQNTKDPRIFQIAALSTLLVFGILGRAFEIPLTHFAVIAGAAILTQWACAKIVQAPFEVRSALITSLSLTLLLRANEAWPLAIAAIIAIGSKFFLRLDGKHIFNPANAGIVALLLLTDWVWTTPGQWGTALWLAAIIAGAGFFVTFRAARLDVPLMFLGAFAGMIILRALWLGDPLEIPLLRLQNGALILFAFFMISDPKTTPDGARARIAFSVTTALLAYVLTYHFFLTDGLFYALALTTAFRPLIDGAPAAGRYVWPGSPGAVQTFSKPRDSRLVVAADRKERFS